MASNPAMSCTLVDNTFGPWAGEHCRGGFDFTLLFEEAILSVTPLVLILCVAPFRIFYLWRKQTKVSKSLLLPAKLVSQQWANMISQHK
jgi:ATP-binding cassette subfamily C (CFTR/MRP) protein 1